LVRAGSETGITDDSFKAIQKLFFLSGHNNSIYLHLSGGNELEIKI